MAKDKNTYAKRQREALKRQKGEAKRERRRKRKEQPNVFQTETVHDQSSVGVGPDEDRESLHERLPPAP